MDNLNSKINKAFIDKGALEIQEFYTHLFKHEARKIKRINFANTMLKIAASITLLFLFTRAYYIDNINYPELKPYEIVAIDFYIQELPTSFRGNSKDISTSIKFNRLIADYKYKEATELCLNNNSSTNNEAWELIAGQCLMQIGKYDSALYHLSNIEQGSPFENSATYYAMGCYIASGNIKNAQTEALKLRNSSYYSKKIEHLNQTYNLCLLSE